PDQGDQTAWCAAMVCWTLQHAGVVPHHPNSAGSIDFRDWATRTDDPQPGDIVVFKSKSQPAHGHVAFFDGFSNAEKSKLYLLGGNQANRISRANWARESKDLVLH